MKEVPIPNLETIWFIKIEASPLPPTPFQFSHFDHLLFFPLKVKRETFVLTYIFVWILLKSCLVLFITVSPWGLGFYYRENIFGSSELVLGFLKLLCEWGIYETTAHFFKKYWVSEGLPQSWARLSSLGLGLTSHSCLSSLLFLVPLPPSPTVSFLEH